MQIVSKFASKVKDYFLGKNKKTIISLASAEFGYAIL